MKKVSIGLIVFGIIVLIIGIIANVYQPTEEYETKETLIQNLNNYYSIDTPHSVLKYKGIVTEKECLGTMYDITMYQFTLDNSSIISFYLPENLIKGDVNMGDTAVVTMQVYGIAYGSWVSSGIEEYPIERGIAGYVISILGAILIIVALFIYRRDNIKTKPENNIPETIK